MVFGSAGTITTLADTDTRLTGETKVGSLTVLRRPRLKTLLDILKNEPVERRASLNQRRSQESGHYHRRRHGAPAGDDPVGA